MDKLEMHTRDLTEENFKKLAALFPNAVTETAGENGEIVRAIDADVLRQEISAEVVEGAKERYQFNWPDKKKSVVLANQPIAKTLRLSREKSAGRDGTPGSIDTENIYIEGDNLDALKLLQETYLGKVKMIYIRPTTRAETLLCMTMRLTWRRTSLRLRAAIVMGMGIGWWIETPFSSRITKATDAFIRTGSI